MKTLSQFVETSLESVRPGSRPVGGPELPAAGDKTSKEYQGPQPADNKATGPAAVAPAATSPVKVTAPSASEEVKEEETKTPSTTMKTNPAKAPKKPFLTCLFHVKDLPP